MNDDAPADAPYLDTVHRVIDAVGQGLRAGLTHAQVAEILLDLARDYADGGIAIDPWGPRDSRVGEDLMAKAISVFGDLGQVRRWLVAPALALGWQRPIDLLLTPQGRRQVEELICRLEYGVYP